MDWDSAECSTSQANSRELITNLQQTPLNRRQQLPTSYRQLLYKVKQNGEQQHDSTILTNTIGQKSRIQTRYRPNNLAVFTDIVGQKRPKTIF